MQTDKIFALKVGFNDTIAQLKTQQRRAVDMTQAKIERLKEVGK